MWKKKFTNIFNYNMITNLLLQKQIVCFLDLNRQAIIPLFSITFLENLCFILQRFVRIAFPFLSVRMRSSLYTLVHLCIYLRRTWPLRPNHAVDFVDDELRVLIYLQLHYLPEQIDNDSKHFRNLTFLFTRGRSKEITQTNNCDGYQRFSQRHAHYVMLAMSFDEEVAKTCEKETT
jgi:hypothetical protein